MVPPFEILAVEAISGLPPDPTRTYWPSKSGQYGSSQKGEVDGRRRGGEKTSQR